MEGVIARIAEQRIRQAMERGELDDLPGKGAPLNLAEEDRVPEELRLAYKVLKNAGYVPPEIELRKEIVQVEDMLADCLDERERYRQIKKLNFLVTKLNMLKARPAGQEAPERYQAKLADRLGRASSPEGGGAG